MASLDIARLALASQAVGATVKRDDICEIIRKCDAATDSGAAARLPRSRVDAEITSANERLRVVFGAQLVEVEAAQRSTASTETSEGRRRALEARERKRKRASETVQSTGTGAYILQRVAECVPLVHGAGFENAAVLMAAASVIYLSPKDSPDEPQAVDGGELLAALSAMGTGSSAASSLLELRHSRALATAQPLNAPVRVERDEDAAQLVSAHSWMLGPRGRVEAPPEAVLAFITHLLGESASPSTLARLKVSLGCV